MKYSGQAQASKGLGENRLVKRAMQGTVLGMLVVLIAFAASSGSQAQASQVGDLFQDEGAYGCISRDSSDACGVAANLWRPGRIAVSPNGSNAYVTTSDQGGAVSKFTAFGSSGHMLATGCVSGTAGDANCETGYGFGLQQVAGVAVSADNQSIYASSPTAIGEFQNSGSPSQLGQSDCLIPGGYASVCGKSHDLVGSGDLAASPDGKHLYAAFSGAAQGGNRGGVGVFNISPGRRISQDPGMRGCIADADDNHCNDARGLAGAEGVVVSPDGKNVYTTSTSGAVTALTRPRPPRCRCNPPAPTSPRTAGPPTCTT